MTNLSKESNTKKYFLNNESIKLTPSELKIMSYLVSGYRTKEIAWKLNINKNTINSHLNHIKVKFKCVNIFQLGLVLGNLIVQNKLEFNPEEY